MANIDLIPQEEKLQRTKQKAQKVALITSIVLFLIVSGMSVGGYFYIKSFDTKIENLNSQIESNKQKIAQKSELEVLVRTLDAKYKILKSHLASRLYYSVFLDELASRVPAAVSITSIEYSVEDTVNVTADTTDYVSLAKFLNSLTDPSISSTSANTKDQNIFKEVALNSVTLDTTDAGIRFNLKLTVNPDLLKKD